MWPFLAQNGIDNRVTPTAIRTPLDVPEDAFLLGADSLNRRPRPDV
jgi:hypothetical protein